MKMKGILKHLATLTIMAALVLCLLPLGASAETTPVLPEGVTLTVTFFCNVHGEVTMTTSGTNRVTDTNGHSFSVNSYTSTIEDGNYSISADITVTACENDNDSKAYDFRGTYECGSQIMETLSVKLTEGGFTDKLEVTLTREATDHSFNNGVCTACKYNCEHENLDQNTLTHSGGKHNGTCSICGLSVEGYCIPGEDGNCTVCKTALVASLTSSGENATTTYYATVDEAFAAAQAARSGTVTVLANAEYTREKSDVILYSENISLVVNPNVTLTTSTFLRLYGSISGGGTIAETDHGWLVTYDGSTIKSGTFTGEVENGGTIEGGTFSGKVYNNGTIKGGTFSETVINHNYYIQELAGTISGGTFNCTVENTPGTITGGTFNGKLTNEPYSPEYDDISNTVDATVNADNLTLGDNFSFTNNGGTVNCTTHQRTTPATCTAPKTCIFCGHTEGERDDTAHSLTYSIATDSNNTITETCAHGCTHSATATLDISTDSVTYNGAAQTIATVTHSGTWLGERLTAQYENNTNVGTATVYIQAGDARVSKTFEIAKATPEAAHFTITLPQNAVYDDTEKPAEVKLAAAYTGVGDITVKYFAGETELEAAPINAGTYTVKFSVAEGTNFKAMALTEAGSFEIAKADPIKTAPVAIENLVYTGSPQRLTTIGYTANSAHKVLYWFNIGDVYSEQVLTATNAGAYTVKWYAHIGDDPNYGNKQGEIAVTIAPATITVTPKANQSITYGNEINLTYDPIDQKGTEIPRFTGKLTIDGTKAGTYKIKKGTLALADDESTGFKASNYTLVVDETVDFVIKPRALTLTVEDQTITYGESIDQAEYTVEGLADGDKATVKLTPSTENITKSGTITAEITIKNAAGEDVTGCYDISKNSGKLTIDPDLSAIENLTVDNVHHSNEEDIKAVQDMLDKAEADVKNDQNITEAQQKCANLLVQIHKSLDALRTDAIEDTLGTTASNVKLADKATVTKAIDDIEKAKTNYAGNYSEADIAALDAQIANLEAALDAIEKAETVIDWMNGLPADVEPDDAKAIEAKAAYDELTSNEKNMVASATATKLAALSTYKIVKGDKATWEKGKTLTFTINGDINRFTGIKVGNTPVKSNYTIDPNSTTTIITLEKDFFEKFSSKPSYQITFLFNDGDVMGTFYIHKDAMTPATGDSSGIVLWTVILFASAAALAAVIVISRKRKNV